MSKNVIVLGAGASAHANLPVMNNFLEKAKDLSHQKAFRDLQDDLDNVFEAISEIKLVYEKSYLFWENIEVLFNIIEMANLIGRLGQFNDSKKLQSYRASLINVIVKTLVYGFQFEYFEQRDRIRTNWIKGTQGYDQLAQVLSHIQNENGQVAIITFNYDLALDYALLARDVKITYCLTAEKQEQEISLLKLHGSVNWGMCDVCKEIIPYNLEDPNEFFRKVSTSTIVINSEKILKSLTDKHSSSNGKCKNNQRRNFKIQPYIVPPSWIKGNYSNQLVRIWKQAAEELRNAENIVIAGFSLPETDVFFKYLYALGTLEKTTNINNISVFNFHSTDEDRENTQKRYNAFIGSGVSHRYQYNLNQENGNIKFENSMGYISKALEYPIISNTGGEYSF